MANPYSDLTGGYIGANYNRAIEPFSQFGTRRLNFYVVEIAGYDIENEPGWSIEQGTAGEGPVDGWRKYFDADNYLPDEYLESPKSILFPIIRGIQIKAEVYIIGAPATEWDGEYPYTYITFAVADDTALGGESDWQEGSHPDGKSWWYEDAIDNSLGLNNGDFSYDDVDVLNANIVGYGLDVLWSTDNLSRKVKGAKKPVNAKVRAAFAAKKAALKK